MFRYPVHFGIREALDKLPVLDWILDHRSYIGASHDSREIIRLLGTAHWPIHESLLRFIDRRIGRSGGIGKQLLEETDPVRFRRRLAELYLLAFNRSMGRAAATPVKRPLNSRSYDFDIRLRALRAKVEVYSPIDHYGHQFVSSYVKPLFRYSECGRGFDVDVELIPERADGYYPLDISNSDRRLREWLKRLEPDVVAWLDKADVGDKKHFDGIDEAFQIKATLVESSPVPSFRRVVFHEPTRSTDTRLFFEVLDPEHTAESQIGRDIGAKMCERQCGPPDPKVLRILVVNFGLTDTYQFDWFWWPEITKRIERTMQILAERCGEPLPYDVVLPANLDVYCCFGKPVVLDPALDDKAAELIRQAGFAVQCKPPLVRKPPPELIAALDQLQEQEHDSMSAEVEQLEPF